MNSSCPHCGKVITVTIGKDSNVGKPVSSSSNGNVDTGDLGELLDAAEGNSLSDQASEFVAETRKRYKQYGDKTRMSEKQMNWLKKLAAPKEEESWS